MNKFQRANPLPDDINEAYRQVWCELASEVATLKNVRSKKKRVSNAIRVLVFLCFAAGVLIPLVWSLPVWELAAPADGIAWGYLALTAGGLILLIDQLFGYSTGHARVRLAEMRLLGMLYELEIAWGAHSAATPAAGEKERHTVEAWGILHKSRSAAHSINQTQVEEWMAERERSLALLGSKVPVPAAPVPPRA